uniref:Reverse transcriptase zinc-binding domain-containing protein n=1 Tax=Brassica oleracea var. oleracea TaxID=109376 RepID=A0A0D3BFV6_BRAOL
MFRKIFGMRPKALPFLKISVRNGDSTFFWWDPWTPFGPLFTYLASDGPSLLGIPIDATVADLRTTSGWLLPNARSDKQLLLFSYISSLQLHEGSDVACWSVEDVPSKSLKSKIVFNIIRTQRQRKAWAPLIWHKAVIPRHATTAWLFTLNRNPTFDRIASWSLDVETVCLLCGSCNESRDHLFFTCSFSSAVWWNSIMSRFGIEDLPSSWSEVLLFLLHAPGNNTQRTAFFQGWQTSVYELWRERNRRLHDGLTWPAARVVKLILSSLRDKCSRWRLKVSQGPLLASFWEEGLEFGLRELKQLFAIKRNNGFPSMMILAPRAGRSIIDGIPSRDDRWKEKFFVFKINPASVGDFDFSMIPREWSDEIVKIFHE